MELSFEPSAWDALMALRADPTRRVLAERVDSALRALGANHGDAQCRRRSYGPFGWGIAVRTRDDEWLIIWRLMPPQGVIVRYIGKDL